MLLDYKMPNGDGIQAASEIEAEPPETPVVIFTLYKTSELESTGAAGRGAGSRRKRRRRHRAAEYS